MRTWLAATRILKPGSFQLASGCDVSHASTCATNA